MRMRFRFAGAGPTMPNPGLWLALCFAAFNALALSQTMGG